MRVHWTSPFKPKTYLVCSHCWCTFCEHCWCYHLLLGWSRISENIIVFSLLHKYAFCHPHLSFELSSLGPDHVQVNSRSRSINTKTLTLQQFFGSVQIRVPFRVDYRTWPSIFNAKLRAPRHVSSGPAHVPLELVDESQKYRVSHKKIVFRNGVLFLVAGAWVFKIWIILGSKNIHAITRCLELVPNVSTLVCTPLSLYTPLNGHLIRGFAIFLKTIFFWDTL